MKTLNLNFSWHNVRSIKGYELENFFIFYGGVKGPLEAFYLFGGHPVPALPSYIIIAGDEHMVNRIVIFLDVENCVKPTHVLFELLLSSHTSFI